jgi:hypothetical protein
MNIFKKIISAITFVPKTIFEASQECADFLNKVLIKADGNIAVDNAEKVMVDLVCLALSTQGISISDLQKDKVKSITVQALDKANPKIRKALKWYSNIGD